jgi:hypothetical protein
VKKKKRKRKKKAMKGNMMWLYLSRNSISSSKRKDLTREKVKGSQCQKGVLQLQ